MKAEGLLTWDPWEITTDRNTYNDWPAGRDPEFAETELDRLLAKLRLFGLPC